MNKIEKAQISENDKSSLEKLREDLSIKQKSGLPFIIASVVIWTLILIICSLNLKISVRNMLVFCCSCPLMPIAMLSGKLLKIDIFDKENPLGKLGFLFTLNQMIYLLIVMWAFAAYPEKMVMIYAMVFGAHLLPYSWLYKEKFYLIAAIVLPIAALILEHLFSTQIMTIFMVVFEFIFALSLWLSSKKKK